MSAAALAARFENAGMGPSDAASRAALLDRVEAGFRERYQQTPMWRAFVPGRVEVFGKHTDYAGGRSLLAAIPRGFAMAAHPRGDMRVRAVDLRYREATEVNAADDLKPVQGFGKYVHVVARRLALNFPGAPLGVDLAFASDVPRAAGVSSSSALVVGVAMALARRANLPARDVWQRHIRSPHDLAWYLGCVENGLDYPGLPGWTGVGTLGGSEDHTAIVACRAGHVSQYHFVPVAHLGDVAMPASWTFVVATSGVQADKAGSVRDRYNRASLATRVLLDVWNARASIPATSLGAALASEADACDRLRDWIGDARIAGFATDDLTRRLRHFVGENARVEEAARAFAAGDAEAVGRLASASQREAETLLGNQIAETSALVEAAGDAGAWAASSFGAGFGGSAWALVAAGAADTFGRRWLACYRRRSPQAGAEAAYFVAHPGPPLLELG
jgi:galactokinase